MTPWKQFCSRWKAGCGSELCGRAKTVVQARGSVPADVAFVGEGPGESEDVCGKPFVGPAGANFQKWVIDRSVPRGVSYAICNLLGCIPTDEAGDKAEFPDDDVVHQCSGRLVELLTLVNPKLIVCVGAQAAQFLGPKSVGLKHSIRLPPPLDKVPRVEVIHPAAVLRMNVAQQGLQWQRAQVIVRNAIEDYVLPARAAGGV